MLSQPRVQIAQLYRFDVPFRPTPASVPTTRILVTRNRTAEGLGLPLPSGGVAVFQQRGGRPILVGEGSIDDRAVGEDVEIPMGTASDVRAELRGAGAKNGFELVVTNAGPRPARFEARFSVEGTRVTSAVPLVERDGRRIWAVTIPANGTASLRYEAADQ